VSIRIARVFDGYAPERGPYFAPDRGLLSGPDRALVAGYLRGGTIVARSFAVDPDVVDPARGAVVPASFRTDGTWLWSDALLYYVQTHGIAPPLELATHMAAAGYRCPEPDTAAVRKAAEVLAASTGGTR
jgi:hypothetical protein